MPIASQIELPGFTTKGQKLFKKRAGQLIHALNARMKKKGFSGCMPLDVGRAILAQCVGKPCKYCGEIVKVRTMSPDHPLALSRGGDPWTIEGICIDCQHMKGEMSAEEFARFYAHVRTYTPETQNYIKGMMKAGAAYQRVLAMSRGQMMRKKVKQDGQTDEPFGNE